MDAAVDRRTQLERDGFVVVRDFLAAEEIDRLRGVVSRFFRKGGVLFHLGKTQPNAAIECPDLAFLFSEPKVVDLFREVFAQDDILFTGHCDIHEDVFSRWHKDTHDSAYFEESCFTPDCRIYKMGVYLQDHPRTGGLTVRPGSHRKPEMDSGPGIHLGSRAGDVIVFDVRLDHHGRAPDAVDQGLHWLSQAIKKGLGAIFPALRQPGDVAFVHRLKRGYEALIGRPRKQSVFFTFGAPNRFSHQFARASMARQLRQYEGQPASYPEGLVDRLRAAGVEVYQPETVA